MIPFDTRDVHFTNDIEAFFRIGIVADDIAKAHIVGAFLLFDVLQDHLEGIQVGVDIRYDSKLHVTLSCDFKSAKFIAGIEPLNRFVPDEVLQSLVADRLPKGLELVDQAFRH